MFTCMLGRSVVFTVLLIRQTFRRALTASEIKKKGEKKKGGGGGEEGVPSMA